MPYEINIADPDSGFEATFVPEVGMIGNSLRHEGEELLFQGQGLEPYRAHGSTFALPFLHPWANRLRAWDFELGGQQISLDPESPITHRDGATGTAIHGLLAASTHWTVTDADRDALTAELDFGARSGVHGRLSVPAHRPLHREHRGDDVDRRAGRPCTADVAVPISFGFHPYLTLPGSDRRGWHVEIPVAEQALIDERMLPTGETLEIAAGELDGALGDRTFDTSYPAVARRPPEFVIADERRRLALKHVAGYPVTQVYAPEGSPFICYEPMTAPVDALISGDGLRWAGPGEEFEAVFTISVEHS